MVNKTTTPLIHLTIKAIKKGEILPFPSILDNFDFYVNKAVISSCPRLFIKLSSVFMSTT
jgi:hypothetical protein